MLCGGDHQTEDEGLAELPSSFEEDTESQEEISQDEIRLAPKKDWTRVLAHLSDEWKPLKSQLKKDFPFIQKSRKMEILWKSKKAIDAVLRKIAPEQGNLIFEELTRTTHSSELDTITLAGLQEAMLNTDGKLIFKHRGGYKHIINSYEFPAESQQSIDLLHWNWVSDGWNFEKKLKFKNFVCFFKIYIFKISLIDFS